jgi:neutral ceramidase
MADLRAGFGISTITPKVGCEMPGYHSRHSTGVHDDLHSRSLVIEGGGSIWALSANDICYFFEPTVSQVREQVAARTSIPAGNVFVCATRTHSGPYDSHPEDWERPLVDLVTDAIVQAYEDRVPARVGAGRGRLDGTRPTHEIGSTPVGHG